MTKGNNETAPDELNVKTDPPTTVDEKPADPLPSILKEGKSGGSPFNLDIGALVDTMSGFHQRLDRVERKLKDKPAPAPTVSGDEGESFWSKASRWLGEPLS